MIIRSRPLNGARSVTRKFSSVPFVAPPVNIYNGTSDYTNIDISSGITAGGAGQRRNADPDAVFVVSGANRGIGLGYVRALLERSDGKVVACCRHPEKADTLNAIAEEFGADRVSVLPLDVVDKGSVDRATAEIKSKFGRVDALINNAGVLGGGPGNMGPEKNLAGLNRDFLTWNMEVNVIGPMMLAQGLAPLMAAKKGRKYLDSRQAETVIVNMSARVASISDNVRAGICWHSYRMSKAALNAGTRTMSHELRRQGTWTIALYPGLTDTDLSVPFQKGVKKEMIFPVNFTCERMLNVVDSMDLTHSGGLYDWAGQALPF